MATNADLVKKAESMGITGYDKTTASATGPGTDGRATLRSGGGSDGGGSRGTGSAGTRSGLVSDYGVVDSDAASTVRNMSDSQRESLSRQLGQLGYTLMDNGGVTRSQSTQKNAAQTSGKYYDAAGNYTGPVNNYMRAVDVDDRAKGAISGMNAGQYANLQKQLAQLGVTLGGGSVPEWDTKSRRSFEFERGKQVESPSGQQQLDRYDHYDQRRHEEMLRQILEAALAQQNAKIDYATRQQAEDLNRAVADAEKQYQAQRDAVALDEARALDNSALYAELRGDRGGIGRAQYDSIQNTAAQNRQLIRQAQTQMASDAARQIADLRAQGEFEKADALMQSTQSYLQQLMQLEQYALEYNLNVDQLNNALTQWESEWALKNQRYAIEDARYADETAYNRDQAEMSRSAQLAQSLLESGIPLTDMQREALGITKEQEATMSNLYMLQAAEKAASSRKSGGGGGSSRKYEAGEINITATPGTSAWYKQLYDAYGDEAPAVLSANYKKLGLSAQPNDSLMDGFYDWIDNNVNAAYRSQFTDYGNGDLTKFDYNDDEGVIVWNGRRFPTIEGFVEAVNQYDLPESIAKEIERKARMNGFNITFE